MIPTAITRRKEFYRTDVSVHYKFNKEINIQNNENLSFYKFHGLVVRWSPLTIAANRLSGKVNKIFRRRSNDNR